MVKRTGFSDMSSPFAMNGNLCDTTHVYPDAPCMDDLPRLGEKWSHQQAEMCGTYSHPPYMEHLELQYQPAMFS